MTQHNLKQHFCWGFFLVATIWALYCIFTMTIIDALLFGASVSLLLVIAGMRFWDLYEDSKNYYYLCYSCNDAQVKRKHTLCEACVFLSTLKRDQ